MMNVGHFYLTTLHPDQSPHEAKVNPTTKDQSPTGPTGFLYFQKAGQLK